MNYTRALEARLDGFDGPIFPDSVDKFMAAQDAWDMHNNYSMTKIAKAIPGFKGGTVYLTSDGYYWYFGLHFVSQDSEMVILLPEFGDLNEQTNRMERVRSVAVYLSGEFDYESILTQLIEGIINSGKKHVEEVAAMRAEEDAILGPETIARLEESANRFADALV